ncbi:MAG: YraN family protein [Kiritimatiellia bacterium]|nr:YraN family protein [Kiritimatiellia bacterium]MDP6848620.1 YraN family protein [Kiritimatiellia bacterium]
MSILPWKRNADSDSRPGHLRAGEWGEECAERLLAGKGMKIIGSRVRVGGRDEIDIVARDGSTLVFVEVKTRKSEAFGRPAAAVGRRKRQTISRAAVRYLRKLKSSSVLFRFDVVEVVGIEEDGDPVLRHIENAFPLDSRYSLP